MSRLYKFDDYIMIQADYLSPEKHKHLAYHIIISLGNAMKWSIEGEDVETYGICISPEVEHTGIIPNEGALVFLFTEISDYTIDLKQKYLMNNNYAVIDDKIAKLMACEYKEHINDNKWLHNNLLKLCKIDDINKKTFDNRVCDVINYLENLECIERDVVDKISSKVYLSKSRISHLFKQETGMTLHSYILFEKVRKTFRYYNEGLTLTDACLKAGFGSSSHFSAACKSMFGISMRDVYKTIN